MAVSQGRICYVGPSADHTRGDETRVIDARGRWIAPGFIDAHTHIGHFCRPFELLQAYAPHGTTALMASCDEHTVAFGLTGMRLFLDEVASHPLRVYTLISMAAPQDPLLCRTESLSDQEVAEALRDPRVLGLGEVVSWLRLVQGDPDLLARIEMTLDQGKIVHGHTAGARDRRLNAIAVASVSSCHEPINGEDALARLRLGYWTMLREGSFRQDLEATLKPLLAAGVDTGRLILVTDGMAPDDVAEHGHMDHVIRRAVRVRAEPRAGHSSGHAAPGYVLRSRTGHRRPGARPVCGLRPAGRPGHRAGGGDVSSAASWWPRTASRRWMPFRRPSRETWGSRPPSACPCRPRT